MTDRDGRTRVEFTVRADLLVTARQRAAERDLSVSSVVANALGGYLANPGPAPTLVETERDQLRVRLPTVLREALVGHARQVGSSPRLIVEAALMRHLQDPARSPSWDLGHRPKRP